MRISTIINLITLMFISSALAAGTSTTGVTEIPRFNLPGFPIIIDPDRAAEQVFLLKKFDAFVKQGVPARALRRALSFYFHAYGKPITVKATDRVTHVKLKNDRFLAIADFTQPSIEKRFYLLDLKTGIVEKHYVSHGAKSGFKWAQVFSNEVNSRKTSLGLYITGSTYQSNAFESRAMKVYGLEATNYNAYARDIVIHQADYASPNFIEELKLKFEMTKEPKYSPRLGRSFGCFALDPEVAQGIIEKLRGGALIYAYVKGAEKQIIQSPQYQEVIRVNPALDVGEDTEEELLQRVVKRKKK